MSASTDDSLIDADSRMRLNPVLEHGSIVDQVFPGPGEISYLSLFFWNMREGLIRLF